MKNKGWILSIDQAYIINHIIKPSLGSTQLQNKRDYSHIFKKNIIIIKIKQNNFDKSNQNLQNLQIPSYVGVPSIHRVLDT